MTTIDVHTHFLPTGMIERLSTGHTWHGWTAETDEHGRQLLVSDAGVAPFPLSMADQPWEERIEERRRDGSIDVQAVMLPAFLWNYHLPGQEGLSFCRDVNDEGADLARRHGPAVVPMGVLPLQDATRAIAEVERCVRDLGITTFSIGTQVLGENLDSPGVVRTLEAVCEAGASVMIHASYFERAGESRMTAYDFGNSIGVPVEAGLSLMSVLYSGLLDRHPDARIGSCHGGGWAAYGIGRLWLRYTQGRDGGRLEHPPGHYLTRFFYDCLLHDDLSLELLIRRAGASQVMIGTDHPYKGDMLGGSVAWIRSLEFLTAEQKAGILGGNAGRFLGLGGDA